ncbi:hypothetical protein AMTR_s00078p00065010 [Amborella trichopoda]|uniref:Alpha/beta hydrolase fold-3 domain-containing protein n=1 Tax=Amborella trichopoda TaxID=13333 RepID=W1P9U1_AMBTC|nr:hypothetical protein AMTR_s00078p00065010 [Amborella trichopoda]
MSIVGEIPGFFQLFSSGKINRISPGISPPSSEFTDGFKSKDVTIDLFKPVTARIFVPNTIETSLLPLIVYFHGGGFCIGSTTWSGFHNFLGGLSVVSHSIVVSVDYRLAPENRIPEPWLERSDLSRVFLSGESAGGNITYHVALQSLHKDLSPMEIKGILVIHPYFGSEARIESEKGKEVAHVIELNDMFWRLSLPEAEGRDHYACSFKTKADGLSEIEWTRFPSVKVFVAGADVLRERGVLYAEFLKREGVRVVELVEAQGEPHAYHVYYPRSKATHDLQKQMSEFVHRF